MLPVRNNVSYLLSTGDIAEQVEDFWIYVIRFRMDGAIASDKDSKLPVGAAKSCHSTIKECEISSQERCPSTSILTASSPIGLIIACSQSHKPIDSFFTSKYCLRFAIPYFIFFATK